MFNSKKLNGDTHTSTKREREEREREKRERERDFIKLVVEKERERDEQVWNEFSGKTHPKGTRGNQFGTTDEL